MVRQPSGPLVTLQWCLALKGLEECGSSFFFTCAFMGLFLSFFVKQQLVIDLTAYFRFDICLLSPSLD